MNFSAKVVIIIMVICVVGEIDRCLKKVQEGVDIFEDLWQKVSMYISVMYLCLFV